MEYCVKCTGETVEENVCRNCGHVHGVSTVSEESIIKKAVKKLTKK